MPIRTKIDVEANPEKFKESLALFQRYQVAMKELYGGAVLQAPYLKAVNAAGDDLAKFVDHLDKAAATGSRFAAAAQKAGSAFQGLASGVRQTLENLARYALSPLQLLFPAGLVVGLAGLGAGLIGAGALYGLDREASEVSDRRRRAMGLGVSYGSLSAYDLNFSRFGVGEGTLGAVAGGIYDFTSPAYLGLMSSGATGHGDTTEAAIDLIRKIPQLLQGVPDQMVGPVARSRNLTSILDLPTILRLRAHPEEIEDQIKRFREDRQKFDISKDAQEKWASFNAALERAGNQIELSLGRTLVALTPGLIKFSDDMVKFIDAFVDLGAMTEAMKGIEGGLQWLESAIGSSTFKQDAKSFLVGLDKLTTVAGPALITLMQIEGALGAVGLGGLSRALKRVTINGATFWVIGAGIEGALTGKLFEPTTGANKRLAQDLGLEPRGDTGSAPRLTGTGAPSIRYGTGRGQSRAPSAIIDTTPRLAGEGGGSGWNATVGSIPGDFLAKVQKANPQLTPRQCVELVQATMGVGNVHDWRRGPSEKDSPEGAALATFGVHGDSNLYAYGGSGTPGIGRDHALKMVKKYPDGSFDAVSQDIGHPAHLIHMPWTGQGGEGDASSYFEIFDKAGRPAGENAKLFNERHIGAALPVHPSSTGRMPIGEPLQLPGAAPGMKIGDTLHFDNHVGLRNKALRMRGHILDHMDNGPPPGPIVVHDMTGGSAVVTLSRHQVTQ